MTLPFLPKIMRLGEAWLTALSLTILLTPLVRSLAVRTGIVARPVEDRWGRRAIARLGGVAMFVGFLGTILLWLHPRGTSPVSGLILGSILVFLLGLCDDIRAMPPYTKLVAQLLIGCIVVANGGIRIELIQWPWVAIPLSIIWLVFTMNAFNLLDNMDGLAAGVGAIAAGFCAIHSLLGGNWIVALSALIVNGICLGFLTWNFPPAKIFMGDSGSHLIGFSLASLALMGSWHHSAELISVLAVPILILAVPIFDTCFVTVQRVLNGHHPFQGGTDHVSHRLAVLGLSTQQTVLVLYGISFCLGLISIVTTTLRPMPMLAIWLATLTSLILLGCYLSQVNVYRLESPPLTRAVAGVLSHESQQPATLIETMLLHKRRLLEVLVDFSLICSAYVSAYALRFEGAVTGSMQALVIQSLPVILVIKLACFGGCGLYRGIWRYLGVSDILTVVKAVTLGSVLSSLALLYLWRFTGYSRAVFIIDWMLTLLAVGGSRIAGRLLDDWINRAIPRTTPVLVIGAGDTGARILRHLQYDDHRARRVIGFLDDDPRKQGGRIHGCPVLGGRLRLSALLDQHGVHEVLIAINDPPGELLQHVQQCCAPRNVTWKIVTTGVLESS